MSSGFIHLISFKDCKDFIYTECPAVNQSVCLIEFIGSLNHCVNRRIGYITVLTDYRIVIWLLAFLIDVFDVVGIAAVLPLFGLPCFQLVCSSIHLAF